MKNGIIMRRTSGFFNFEFSHTGKMNEKKRGME